MNYNHSDLRVGDKVKALIYRRNQTWMDAKITRITAYPPNSSWGNHKPLPPTWEEVTLGYRPGVTVEIEDGSKYWVDYKDVKKIAENTN